MESLGARNKDVTGPEADPIYCCFILIAFLFWLCLVWGILHCAEYIFITVSLV